MEIKKIEDINEYKSKSVNPQKNPDDWYELYSVPNYGMKIPEIVQGKDIASSKQIVEEGDILISKINPRINRVWIVSNHTNYTKIASSEWIVVRTKEHNNKYLSYYFKSEKFKNLLCSQVTGIGGSLTRAQPKNVKKYTVPLLSINKQKKVVELLDGLVNVIEKRHSQLTLLDELIQSVFLEMFGDIKTNNNGYPMEKIGNIIDDKINKVKKVYSANETFKYIDIASINNKTNVIENWSEFTVSEAPSRAQQCLEYNDILISTVRPNLKNIALFRFKEKDFVGTSGFCVLRSKTCNPWFLFRVVLSDVFTNDMISKTSGANYPAIKTSDVYDYKIPLPPLELQTKFAQKVEQIEKQKSVLQISLMELEKFYHSLIQKAFKGELFQEKV